MSPSVCTRFSLRFTILFMFDRIVNFLPTFLGRAGERISRRVCCILQFEILWKWGENGLLEVRGIQHIFTHFIRRLKYFPSSERGLNIWNLNHVLTLAVVVPQPQLVMNLSAAVSWIPLERFPENISNFFFSQTNNKAVKYLESSHVISLEQLLTIFTQLTTR